MLDLKYFDEVLKYINELSNTIDLSSTRVRAEGLFYKFQRTIEAADRNGNFPAPSTSSTLKQRRQTDPGSSSSSSSAAAASASASTTTSSSAGGAAAKGKGPEVKGPVISPELRVLLSREIVKAK